MTTSRELDERYVNWRNQTDNSGGHTTQIRRTSNTYRKIGKYIQHNMKNCGKILDASSGFGDGTDILRQMGFDVEDVEPFISNKRTNAPTYNNYDEINGKYDVIISNAVLNVIPDDWRAELLHNMVEKLNHGGKLFINVRDVHDIIMNKHKIELSSPSEILVIDSKGRIKAYQKGFTQSELEKWVKSEIGEYYIIEKATEKNSGITTGSRAVVITKK